MMKLIIMMLILFFLINNLNKHFLQMFYQNIMFLMFMYLYMSFSMNNYNMWMMLYYNIGMDFYSWGLIMLTLWIFSMMIMASKILKLNKYFIIYLNLINMMLLMLYLCFSSINLMMFYIYFESSLIPVFLLILGWGFQVERIQAGFYMMLYTLFGSMPLFMMIIYLYNINNSLMFSIMEILNQNLLIYMSLMLAFLIKMPMYFVHLWLPKAHVEAPIIGSMILAGVMLKLGSYGMMRLMLMLIMMNMMINKFIIIISLMGGIFSSLICLNQIDMKMLVAYSSVVHMSVLMAGIMTLSNWGYLGGYLMMLAHGLCSSGLFCLVNLNYERLMSRSLMISKGMINYFPSLSMMWFLLSSSNLSFPPSLNLFSEIYLFNSLLMWNKLMIFILMLISFFSASYTLYLYSFSQHGSLNLLIFNFFMLNIKEFMLLLLHWIPLNLMFLMMFMFI